MKRFAIRIDRAFGVLAWMLGMSRERSFVEIRDGEVRVEMGRSFRARFPELAVISTRRHEGWTLSRGVHGFAGRWLVNGSGRGIVEIELAPGQRASVLGFPVKLRQLLVSLEDPEGLLEALPAGR